MGTHPIFESDFDCLTENEIVFFGSERDTGETFSLPGRHSVRHHVGGREGGFGGTRRQILVRGLCHHEKRQKRGIQMFPALGIGRNNRPRAKSRRARRSAPTKLIPSHKSRKATV